MSPTCCGFAATLATFDDLHFTNYDDIDGTLIKAAVSLDKIRTPLTISGIVSLIKTKYGLPLRESVVASALSCIPDDIVLFQKGYYFFEPDVSIQSDKMITAHSQIFNIQLDLIEKLLLFIETNERKGITTSVKKKILGSFYRYLLYDDSTDAYGKRIAEFVAVHSDSVRFTNNLSKIREGVILYEGLRFTPRKIRPIRETHRWPFLTTSLAPRQLSPPFSTTS